MAKQAVLPEISEVPLIRGVTIVSGLQQISQPRNPAESRGITRTEIVAIAALLEDIFRHTLSV